MFSRHFKFIRNSYFTSESLLLLSQFSVRFGLFDRELKLLSFCLLESLVNNTKILILPCLKIPEILLSGNHKKISQYREKESKKPKLDISVIEKQVEMEDIVES